MSPKPAHAMHCHFCARPVSEFVCREWRRLPVRRRARGRTWHCAASAMPIDDELRAQILRYHFVEHWRVGTIASQLGVHHSTVERVLGEAGYIAGLGAADPNQPKSEHRATPAAQRGPVRLLEAGLAGIAGLFSRLRWQRCGASRRPPSAVAG